MLLSLNNIAHHIKHPDSPHLGNNSSYGALDLSNDEAQHPSQVDAEIKLLISNFQMLTLPVDHQQESGESTPPRAIHRLPPTFSGSVSRENSRDSGRWGMIYFLSKWMVSETEKMASPGILAGRCQKESFAFGQANFYQGLWLRGRAS